eukprot:1157391-Pelagomonas_calceolata.AAC.5
MPLSSLGKKGKKGMPDLVCWHGCRTGPPVILGVFKLRNPRPAFSNDQLHDWLLVIIAIACHASSSKLDDFSEC